MAPGTIRNQQVGGSNPPVGSIVFKCLGSIELGRSDFGVAWRVVFLARTLKRCTPNRIPSSSLAESSSGSCAFHKLDPRSARFARLSVRLSGASTALPPQPRNRSSSEATRNWEEGRRLQKQMFTQRDDCNNDGDHRSLLRRSLCPSTADERHEAQVRPSRATNAFRQE